MPTFSSIGRCLLFLSFFILAGIGGCTTDLYRNLSEKDANAILALLISNGVEADKIQEKNGILISVPTNAVSKSIRLLESEGLPKQHFDSLGTIFKKEGLISTPSEERMRLIYALSQELSHTLSYIEGVLAARVHVVLPKSKDMQAMYPSSVSVFIKHDESINMQPILPKIKMMVVNSIEGLDYEKVSVFLFPSSKVSIPKIVDESNMPIILLIAALIFIIGVGAGGYFLYRRKSKAKKNDDGKDSNESGGYENKDSQDEEEKESEESEDKDVDESNKDTTKDENDAEKSNLDP